VSLISYLPIGGRWSRSDLCTTDSNAEQIICIWQHILKHSVTSRKSNIKKNNTIKMPRRNKTYNRVCCKFRQIRLNTNSWRSVGNTQLKRRGFLLVTYLQWMPRWWPSNWMSPWNILLHKWSWITPNDLANDPVCVCFGWRTT